MSGTALTDGELDRIHAGSRTRGRGGPVCKVVALAVTAAALTACSGSGASDRDVEVGTESSGTSCAAEIVTANGTRFVGWGDGTRVPRPGRSLKDAEAVPCAGSGDDGAGEPIAVRAIPGIEPSVAVLSGGQVWLAEGAQPPALLQESQRPPRCDETGVVQFTGVPEEVRGDLSGGPFRVLLRTDARGMTGSTWQSVLVPVTVSAADAQRVASTIEQGLADATPVRVRVKCDGGRYISASV